MEQEKESWKTIIGFPDYQISNEGNIWTNKSKQLLKIINGDVKLYDINNKYYTKSVDKLRREHFYESNETELWKDIKEFSNYQISNQGNVWSKVTSKLLKPDEKKNSIRLYPLENGSKSVYKSIKKLVKQHFDEESDEIFEPIPNWERYSISRSGKVKDNKQGIFIEPYSSTHGYLSLSLMGKTEKGNTKHLHVLLAETFIPNPNNFPQLHHKDVNKLNNELSNLKWVSQMENTQSKNQTRPIGSVFKKKDGWKAEVNVYGKKYQFECVKKEVAEEWLERRRIEILNDQDIESTGFIFPSRKSYKVRIRINNEVYSFLHKDKSACEDFMKNLIEKQE
jgi:hypothetical protein